MPHFLFVVQMPPNSAMSSSPGYPYEWTDFENQADKILKPLKTVVRLQKNVWLIPANNTWEYLMGLSTMAASHKLSYSMSLISGDVMHLTKP